MRAKQAWYKSSRLWIPIAGTVGLALFSAYLWGFPTANYLFYRQQAKKFPILNYKPVDLDTVTVNHHPGMVLTHKGLSFEVPWTDLDQAKSKTVGAWVIFSFSSGAVLTLCPPGNGEDLRDVVAKQFGGDRQKLASAFGIGSEGTNYAFHLALLKVS